MSDLIGVYDGKGINKGKIKSEYQEKTSRW